MSTLFILFFLTRSSEIFVFMTAKHFDLQVWIQNLRDSEWSQCGNKTGTERELMLTLQTVEVGQLTRKVTHHRKNPCFPHTLLFQQVTFAHLQTHSLFY